MTKQFEPAEFAQQFEANHAEVKGLLTDAGGKIDAVKKRTDEVDGRLTEIEQKLARRPGGGSIHPETWGAQVARSAEIKTVSSGWKGRLRVEVKATTITSATTNADGSAGDLLVADRQAGIIDLPRRRLRVRDLFAQGRTNGNSIEWPKMTSRTNRAETVAEAGLKPQSDMRFDLVQWPVRTLAHFVVASKQILDDVPALQSIIDSELRYGLKIVEDDQLLLGSGSGTDLTGVYTSATAFSAPFSVGSPTMVDVLLQALAQVEAADYEADGIVVNPIDWRLMQSLKDAEERYLLGSPMGEIAQKLWQLPMVPSKAMTRDKFLVGAFREGAQIFDREDANLEISTEDGDNFKYNLVTLRGEERLAFVIKHADAFVKGDFANVTT